MQKATRDVFCIDNTGQQKENLSGEEIYHIVID